MPKSAVSQPSAKSKSSGAVSPSTSDASQISAADTAGTPFQIPALPQENTLRTTLLGLAALIVVGVGGALYVRNSASVAAETTPTAEEFDITTG